VLAQLSAKETKVGDYEEVVNARKDTRDQRICGRDSSVASAYSAQQR
jgi:hypothetical protein